VKTILAGLGFVDVAVTKKENSEEIIRGWNLGAGAERSVFSAYISGRKPE
jgi:hypothetical protein